MIKLNQAPIKNTMKYGGGRLVNLVAGNYQQGRLAIQAKDLDGMLEATLTVNLPASPLKKDEIYVKDYAENEGAAAMLIANDIVSERTGEEKSGFVTIGRYKLTGRVKQLVSPILKGGS